MAAFRTHHMTKPGQELLPGTIVGLTQAQYETRKHLVLVLGHFRSDLIVCKSDYGMQFKVSEGFQLEAHANLELCLKGTAPVRRKREPNAGSNWQGFSGDPSLTPQDKPTSDRRSEVADSVLGEDVILNGLIGMQRAKMRGSPSLSDRKYINGRSK